MIRPKNGCEVPEVIFTCFFIRVNATPVQMLYHWAESGGIVKAVCCGTLSLSVCFIGRLEVAMPFPGLPIFLNLSV